MYAPYRAGSGVDGEVQGIPIFAKALCGTSEHSHIRLRAYMSDSSVPQRAYPQQPAAAALAPLLLVTVRVVNTWEWGWFGMWS